MARTKYINYKGIRMSEQDAEYYSRRAQEEDWRKCPVCGFFRKREDMDFSRDCHGIPFRLVCNTCLEQIYEEKGYDGEYYTSADENIEEDY